MNKKYKKWLSLQLDTWCDDQLISAYQRESILASLDNDHKFRVKRYLKWMISLLLGIFILAAVIIWILLLKVKVSL